MLYTKASQVKVHKLRDRVSLNNVEQMYLGKRPNHSFHVKKYSRSVLIILSLIVRHRNKSTQNTQIEGVLINKYDYDF